MVRRREERGRHVDQDADPGAVLVAKGLVAEEDGGDDARAQVTSQVSADAGVGQAPSNDGVGEANTKRALTGTMKGFTRSRTARITIRWEGTES